MSRTIHFADKGVRARTAASEPEVLARLRETVGAENVLVDEERVEPYAGDALKEKFPPEAVVLPQTTEEVSAILRLANERRFHVTARGGGVGYTGGAVPVEGGIVIGTDRMNRIREVSVENLYAITEPGVTTYALQQAVEEVGLFYPPDPASLNHSALGGNVAECAGGPRAFKYGTTKRYVLALEAVLPTGEVVMFLVWQVPQPMELNRFDPAMASAVAASAVSRIKVQVVWRDRRSISPDWSAVKR